MRISNVQGRKKSVTQAQAFSRMDRSSLGSWWWTVYLAMMWGVLLLMAFGVALVATASPSVAQQIDIADSYHFLKRHILFLVPTLGLMIALSMASPRMIWRIASAMLVLGGIGMVLVLFEPENTKGARRWIDILGMSVQPSEFVKPAFAVVAAWLIALQKMSANRVGGFKTEISKTGFFREKKLFPGLRYAIILYVVLIALLLRQPDLGMTVVLTCVFAVQVFLAGLRFRYVAALFGLGTGGLTLAYIGFPHVKSRIDRFWNPESGDNYQVEKSIDAIRNGGFFGTGVGQGEEKTLLPDAHADFIFSVMAEEMGTITALFIIGVYLFILLRGFKRLAETADIFSVVAVGGLLSMIGLQAIIHMGSSLVILPAKGMTLPFISYGGSSLLAMGISMGMVLALTRRKKRTSIARQGMMMRRANDRMMDRAEDQEA